MVMKFTNNATSTLASGITNVATSMAVASGQGSLFPTAGAGDYFYCTLANISGTVEIVKVTARSTDTFTIVRAQDGTSNVAWNSGDKVELRLVAASLNDLPKLDENNTFTGTNTFSNGTVLGTPTSGTLTNCTADGTNLIGYRGVPLNSQAAGYTLVLADAGKQIYFSSAGAFTIPANGTVAFPIGTAITFVNMSTSSTIAITTDTMYLAGPGTTGTRTLAQYGIATALKMSSTTWIISGNGLT